MKSSLQFRLFAGVAGLLCIINLLIANDYATLWSGPESALAWDATGEASLRYLPALLQGLVWEASGGNHFLYRLPGVVWLLAAAAGFFLLARPLFGQRTTVLALLVAGASLGLPQLAKIGGADSLLLALHTLGFLFLLRFLKKPGMGWRLAFYAAVLLAGLVHPFSTLILFGIGPVFFYSSRPQRKNLVALQPWLAGLAAFALGWWAIPDIVSLPFFVRGPGYAHYWLLILGGFLPFTGFIIAGVRDYLPKVRKGDEMAAVLIFWSLPAFLAHSPVLAMPLALIIARQMDAFFQPNYPYGAWLKTGAILHLIGVFFAVMGVMMSGLYYFEGAGFRAGVAVGAAYWSMSFLGVIGLYGRQRRLVIGAPILAGALAVFLFWGQVFPLWENMRKMEIGLLSDIPAQTEQEIYVLHVPGTLFPNLAVYGRQKFTLTRVQVTPNLMKLPWVGEGQPAFFLFAPADAKGIPAGCQVWKTTESPVGGNVSVWECGAG